MDSKVRVVFSTEYEEYRVADSPFVLPIGLGRRGLSEVINHLLSINKDDSIAFDFIIREKILSSSLRKFMEAHKMSAEDIISIEYIPAVTLPEDHHTEELPAWVGSIDTSMSSSVITACYDGQVHIFDASGLHKQLSFQAHDESIRAVRTAQQIDKQVVITGSKDQSIKIYSIELSKKGKLSSSHIGTLLGHRNSIESLDVWTAQHTLLSGDWSGNIFGWNLAGLENSAEGSDTSGVAKKKKKISSTATVHVHEVKAAFTLRGHSQSVSGIQAVGEEDATSSSNRVFSCSWDHSLKEWDMERQDCISTFMGSKVMTSLHYSSRAGAVLTSHADGRVRLWDTRQRRDEDNSGGCKSSFGAPESKHWVAQVRWHPATENIFASVNYDGELSVWDVRSSTVALGSKHTHDGKGLCVDWTLDGEDWSVLTGGSDCALTSTRIENIARRAVQ